MKYLDEEDKEKLHELGTKILQAKKLTQEIAEFFVTNGEANYHSTEELLEIIDLYIRGESLDYIGEQVWQDDRDSIKDVLQSMGIDDE